MDTETTERGAVTGPRRATLGPAVGTRNLVGCSKKAAIKSRMVRQQGVVPEAAGCMVVACFLYVWELGAVHRPRFSRRPFFALQFALTTAYPSHHIISRDQILSRERGQGNTNFPCSADHAQDWLSYPVDPYSCYMCDHTWDSVQGWF